MGQTCAPGREVVIWLSSGTQAGAEIDDPTGLGRRHPGALARRLRDGGVGVHQATDVEEPEDDQQEDGHYHSELDERLALLVRASVQPQHRHQLLLTIMFDEQSTLVPAGSVWFWIFLLSLLLVKVPVKPASTCQIVRASMSFQYVW